MRIISSSAAVSVGANPNYQKYLSSITEAAMIDIVNKISIPRHIKYNAKNNKFVADWIFSQFTSFGYETYFQGSYSNVVALSPNAKSSSVILVGAHYDSVPHCPGADDNASAIAAMIACAKAVSEFAPNVPVCFVAFNAEEDGLVGSTDFVRSYLPTANLKIAEVHILEMVGYATDEPLTQTMPARLPVNVPTTGNFLGIMGNADSRNLVDSVLSLGKSYIPDFPVLGLKLYMGIENLVPDLGRSDHLPFWKRKIPALMWTDTADFRNPNYHKLTDTPETLNYSFLSCVTRLMLLQILNFHLENF